MDVAEFIEIGEAEVRGRAKPIRIFALAAERADAGDQVQTTQSRDASTAKE